MRTRWLAVAVAVLGLFPVAGARAGSEEPAEFARARALSDSGLAHFNQARYRQAITEFEASYALRPLPVLQFNIAQAHRLAGDCAQAIEHYRGYLRDVPDAPNRALVEGFIAELEPCARPEPTPERATPEHATPERATLLVTTPPPIAPPAPRQPLYKKWWLWTGVAVVLVAGGVGLGVGLATSGGPPAASLGAVSWRP